MKLTLTCAPPPLMALLKKLSKFIFGLFIVIAPAVAAPTPEAATDSTGNYDAFQELPVEEHFEQWILHERSYTDEFEKEKRFEIFKKNKEYVESFNRAGNRTFTLGINAFSDMTDQEFIDGYLINCSGPPPPLRAPRRHGRIRTGEKLTSKPYSGPIPNVSLDDLPPSVDWVQRGAVTRVKSQGLKCGCCWAFSAVAAVEGLNKIHYGELMDLSEQEVLDCDTESAGCFGGDIDAAFDYVMVNDGIAKEEDYPYTGVKGRCRDDKVEAFGSIQGYKSVPVNNEAALLAVVAQQPASAGVVFGPDFVPEFKNYQGGVYYPGKSGYCGWGLRHAIAVVGYQPNYWVIKNSWGWWWGDGGYMRLYRDGSRGGPCGLLRDASYPIPYPID